MPLSWLVSIRKDKSCIEHYFFITFIYEILEIHVLENISANKDSMIGGLKRIYDEYKPY